MRSPLRVAGVDTRDAKATATVRHAARAAAFVAGPGWLAAFAAPVYWRRWVDPPAGVRPWLAVGLLVAGVGAALVAWRRSPFVARWRARIFPVGADAALVLAILAGITATPRDQLIIAFLLPVGPIAAGWAVGRAARLAVEACVPGVRSAAAGLVITGAMTGLVVSGHLALVLRGSGLARTAVWSIVYLGLGILSFARAGHALEADRARARARFDVSAETVPEDRRRSTLVLDGITVRFGPNEVLRGTSMTADARELVALVGGNGAGKSTLLRVAAGLLTPTSGRVFIAEEDVSDLLPEERAAAGVAFVSGARPVFPDMTVVENLRVAAFRTHLTARAFGEATEAILELVPAIARRRDAKAGVLSGGEQRLLAVAQQLYRRPKALLADELSLGLDAQSRTAVIELLRLLADEGVAVVAVDHDLPTLLPHADRACLLAEGSITELVPAVKILEQREDLLPANFLAGAAT